MTATRIDIPSADESTQEYWDAARRGVLLIKRCAACGKPHFYPPPVLPVLLEHRRALGRGQWPGRALHVLHRAP